MRPATFTIDQIVEAGEYLTGIGQRITGAALSKHLGGGHPTRLRRIWELYSMGQPKPARETQADGLKALMDAILDVKREVLELRKDLKG